MDALITYGGDRVGYSAVRSLAGLGLKVAVADPGRIGLSQFSRYCGKSYRLDHAFINEERFIDDVNRILDDCHAGFLLPSQSETPVLAKYRSRLPEGVILPLDSYEKISMLNDKDRSALYAKSIGINVPTLIEWNTWEELEEKLAAVDYPLVVKLKEGHSAKWVFYPKDSAEALIVCKNLASAHSLCPDTKPIVQKRVSGEGWGVSCLYHEGRKLASFTHRRLRQMPPTGGVSTLRVSARNEVLEYMSERLLDSLGWHGIAMTEFKYDPITGDAWFIEINPRLWGSINLAVASGVDLVALLYVASTEGPDSALRMARPQREGVTARWWLGDAGLAFSEARHMKLVKALKLILPCGADTCDELRSDDPGATLGAIVRSVTRFSRTDGHIAKFRDGRRSAA